MFGLFGKKSKELQVIDQIYISENSKFKACLDLKIVNPDTVFIAWFVEARDKLSAYFKENNLEEHVYLVNNLNPGLSTKSFIFIEHHPLRVEEQKVADEYGKDQITVFSSLTEPIFLMYGSEKIISMMRQMGMQEDEMISHNMVSNSIKKAQDKLASKTIINCTARSQGEWLANAGVNYNPIG